ncbi:hypothetical protein DSO57_1008849 [Entomophthora muscae]|uniref:Uncharacterized protein n=1 Tax=Entomophthora muscae TaxID=34485 RepID=A0ACC2S8U7_9FUNG|nr:hypothetical protein DSO57_1008849 [Entomophthora muscae]
MEVQFSRTGTRGPTNYYRTYDMNRETVSRVGTNMNISAPALYIKAERDFAATLGINGNRRFLHNLTSKSIDGGHWIFLTHKEEVNSHISEWLTKNYP